MKKILIYYSFIIISLMVIVGFVSATSFTQLIVAVLFFPLFVYFATRVLPRRTKAPNIPNTASLVIESPNQKSPKKQDAETIKLKKEGVDIDRRMFLKLIGSAGLSLFFMSMFTKRAEAAFFGSVPGPGAVTIKDSLGNKIDPAEKQPTDGYRISEVDDSTPSYYGYLNKDSAWFILRDDNGSYKYIRGDSGFDSAWADRSNPLNDWEYYDAAF